ncbi:hypothetical protein Q8814_26010, partial [Rhodococcus sp. CC-R104]|nr:hypothetical protein [Rhodococcus sp. CC-R104]
VWRWICQIAVAPYSYDWIDNLGRHSPTELTPGADTVHVGQRIQIFDVVSVVPGVQWTGRTRGGPRRLFGDVCLTYAAEPHPAGSRLVCRIAYPEPRGLGLRSRALEWGDLVMMRKQLLNLRALAERDAQRTRNSPRIG